MSDEDGLLPGDPLAPAVLALREPVPVAPGLAARTTARRRRQRQVRRLTGVGATALLAVAAFAFWPRPHGTTVTFAINAPSVNSVTVVGDFTDWKTDKVPLEKTRTGVWRATVRLKPGRYRYSYLVNQDEWRADSDSSATPDDFGRPTSVLTVREN